MNDLDYVVPETSAVKRRKAMTLRQLWLDERSPAVQQAGALVINFNTFFKQRFNLVTPEHGARFPEARDIRPNESFGVFDFANFNDDPGFRTDSDALKVMRAGVVIAKGFNTHLEAQAGAFGMALDIDDSIPRFKFFAANGYGMFHECLVIDEINFKTDTYLNETRYEPEDIDPEDLIDCTWVVTANFVVGFRLALLKDFHRLHEDLPPDFGIPNPYDYEQYQLYTSSLQAGYVQPT